MSERTEPSDEAQLRASLAAGEDSGRQFVLSTETLSADVTAMANSGGGEILVGVGSDGAVKGLEAEAVRKVNQAVSRLAATAPVPLRVATRNVMTPQGVVVVIRVEEVLSTACPDEDGVVWLRCGAGRRRVTEEETLLRQGALEELQPQAACLPEDVDQALFESYLAAHFPELLKEELSDVERMQRLGFVRGGQLTLAGAMLFDRYAALSLPQTSIQALVISGSQWPTTAFEVERIEGTLSQQVQGAMAFLRRQMGGRAEELAALRALVVNALVHRSLIASSPVRLMAFSDRLEIRSPGALPDGQTMDGLRAGVKAPRNPLLAQHAARLLNEPQGGIPAVLRVLPAVEFESSAERQEFKVTVWRTSLTGGQRPSAPRGEGYALRVVQVALEGEMSRSELQAALGIKSRPTFARCFLKTAQEAGVIEMTLPESPRSRQQKYRLTEKGRQMVGDWRNQRHEAQ